MTTEKFSSAHISEVICGITLKEGLLGKEGYIFELIKTLKKDYPHVRYGSPLADSDLKDFILETNLNYDQTGSILYQLNTSDLHRLVQLQFNKFFYSWLRKDDEDVASYPGYNDVYNSFSQLKTLIQNIITMEIPIKFYELTYQNRIFWQNYINDLSEVDKILKIKLPVIQTNNKVYPPNNVFSKCTIPINKVGGFAIISINSATATNQKQIITFQCTIRGFKENLPMDEWYKIAHNIQIDLFKDIFGPKLSEVPVSKIKPGKKENVNTF